MIKVALDAGPSKRNNSEIIFLVLFLVVSVSNHVAGFCSLSTQSALTTTTQKVRAFGSVLQFTRQQFAATSTTLSSSTTTDLPLQFDRALLEKRYEKELSRRWTDFIRESAPLVQQSAKLWASGRLKRDDPSLATIFRQTLTNLGPAFVKLGQILSVREDILGPVWSAELAKLQNSVDAFGGREAVEDAIANDVTLKDQLLWFESNPVAVASVAQVHKGQWRHEDGSTTEVAIKVLRPNVAYQVGIDLCVLLRAGDILSEWAPRILPVSRVDWQALLAGLARGLWEEVDLSGEAVRQTRFGQNMESVPRVFVPKVLAYNRNVMISEWINGKPLRDIPSMDNRLKAAQALMRDAYCQSMYVDAFFHADGHGGNLLWVEKEDDSSIGDSRGELCILDCGLMVDIEPSAAEGLLRLSIHLASRDWTRVVDDVIALGFLPEDLPQNLKIEARGIARRIIGPYLDVGGGAKVASAYSISMLFDDVSAATMKLPTSLPPDMILLARAVIQLEGLALRAYPNYRLVHDILPVAARIALRSATAQTSFSDGDVLVDDVRSSLLYDLIYEESEDLYGGANEKASFSFQRLLQLLGTARGGDSMAEISLISIEDVVDELLQADAARDVVSQEVMNVIDALIRDSVWRGVDTVEERGLQFLAPPFLWNLLPSPKVTLESLAPRISEQEQLVLLRLAESLKELDETGRSTPPRPTSNERSALDEIPLVKIATIPGVSKSLRDVTFSAVFRGDTKARAAVDAVSEKMGERLRTRLVQTGIPREVASSISTAVLRRPWLTRNR